MGVDTVSGITGKFSGTTLAEGLYSHNPLNVGNNEVLLANVIGQFAGSSDTFIQLNLQNNDGHGSGDIVVTANNGTDTTYFIDMGMNGDLYSVAEYNSMKALDGYLVVQGDTGEPGGNLVIGTATPNKNVNIILGGTTEGDILAQFIDNTGFKMVNRPVIFQDNTSQNTAAAPFALSNASFLQANSAYGSQNVTGTYANSAYTRANAAFIAANSAGEYANSAFLKANTPPAIANSAALYANGAFAKANSALANTSGAIFGGDLRVTGSLTSSNISLTGDASITFNPSASPSTMLFTSRNFQFDGNTGVQRLSTGNLIVDGTANVSGVLNVVGAVNMNATLILANSNFTGTESAVTIKATANVATPSNDGYMLHISGKQNVASRIVFDSYSANGVAYGLVAGRTARGNVDYPAAVQSGDVLMRITGNGYGASEFASLGVARMDIIAAENFTNATRGSQIKFYNCPIGSNTLTNILTLNGDSADFTGVVSPQKGFIYTPRLPAGNQTSIAINYATDSMIKANLVADLTVTHSSFTTGKVVELWLVNSGGTNRTVTHGVSALNSTTNSVTFTIPATSSAYLRYFSIGVDLANTFVSVTHA